MLPASSESGLARAVRQRHGEIICILVFVIVALGLALVLGRAPTGGGSAGMPRAPSDASYASLMDDSALLNAPVHVHARTVQHAHRANRASADASVNALLIESGVGRRSDRESESTRSRRGADFNRDFETLIDDSPSPSRREDSSRGSRGRRGASDSGVALTFAIGTGHGVALTFNSTVSPVSFGAHGIAGTVASNPPREYWYIDPEFKTPRCDYSQVDRAYNADVREKRLVSPTKYEYQVRVVMIDFE